MPSSLADAPETHLYAKLMLEVKGRLASVSAVAVGSTAELNRTETKMRGEVVKALFFREQEPFAIGVEETAPRCGVARLSGNLPHVFGLLSIDSRVPGVASLKRHQHWQTCTARLPTLAA